MNLGDFQHGHLSIVWAGVACGMAAEPNRPSLPPHCAGLWRPSCGRDVGTSQLTGVGAHLCTGQAGTFAHHRQASVKFAVFMAAIKVRKLCLGACTEIAVSPAPFGEDGRGGMGQQFSWPWQSRLCFLREPGDHREQQKWFAYLLDFLFSCCLNPDLIWMEENLVVLITESSKILGEWVCVKTSGGFNKSVSPSKIRGKDS